MEISMDGQLNTMKHVSQQQTINS